MQRTKIVSCARPQTTGTDVRVEGGRGCDLVVSAQVVSTSPADWYLNPVCSLCRVSEAVMSPRRSVIGWRSGHSSLNLSSSLKLQETGGMSDWDMWPNETYLRDELTLSEALQGHDMKPWEAKSKECSGRSLKQLLSAVIGYFLLTRFYPEGCLLLFCYFIVN